MTNKDKSELLSNMVKISFVILLCFLSFGLGFIYGWFDTALNMTTHYNSLDKNETLRIIQNNCIVKEYETIKVLNDDHFIHTQKVLVNEYLSNCTISGGVIWNN